MNKPFQTYNGGKEADGVYQKIINIIPPHDLYIEAFVGNGAIFRYKKPSQYSILIDADTAVARAWTKIQLPPGTNIINTDAISWLKHFKVLANLLQNVGVRSIIYLDPPYPKDSRKSSRDLYNHEMTNDQHIELLSVVVSLQEIPVIISSYPNELYDNALCIWHQKTFTAQTRNGTATEKLWWNYAPPTSYTIINTWGTIIANANW